MVPVWDHVVQFYNHTFENADPRVTDWPMMQSPWPTLVICLSYVYVIKYVGPSLMKNRQPLDVRWLMAVYNFAMVIFSFLIFYWIYMSLAIFQSYATSLVMKMACLQLPLWIDLFRFYFLRFICYYPSFSFAISLALTMAGLQPVAEDIILALH